MESVFINGNRINWISDSERQVLKTFFPSFLRFVQLRTEETILVDILSRVKQINKFILEHHDIFHKGCMGGTGLSCVHQ